MRPGKIESTVPHGYLSLTLVALTSFATSSTQRTTCFKEIITQFAGLKNKHPIFPISLTLTAPFVNDLNRCGSFSLELKGSDGYEVVQFLKVTYPASNLPRRETFYTDTLL